MHDIAVAYHASRITYVLSLLPNLWVAGFFIALSRTTQAKQSHAGRVAS